MSMDPAAALDALGDPTRREIFERVVARPCRIGFLADHVAVSRPAVSQHLKVLKNAGLVREQRDGTRRLYAPNGDGLAALRDHLDGYWDEALAAFKQAAEEPTEGDDDE